MNTRYAENLPFHMNEVLERGVRDHTAPGISGRRFSTHEATNANTALWANAAPALVSILHNIFGECPMDVDVDVHGRERRAEPPVKTKKPQSRSAEAPHSLPSSEILDIFRRFGCVCGKDHDALTEVGRMDVADGTAVGLTTTLGGMVAAPRVSASGGRIEDESEEASIGYETETTAKATETHVQSAPKAHTCCTASSTQDDMAGFWAALASAQHDEYEQKCCFWIDVDDNEGGGCGWDEEYEEELTSGKGGRPMLYAAPAA